MSIQRSNGPMPRSGPGYGNGPGGVPQGTGPGYGGKDVNIAPSPRRKTANAPPARPQPAKRQR